MKKNALILNEGFSTNLGDQAIKDSITQLLSDNGYEVDFAYFSRPMVTEKLNFNGSVESNRRFKKENPRKNLIYRFLILIKNLFEYYVWTFRNKGAIKKKLNSRDFSLIVIGGGQLINTSNKIVPSIFANAFRQWVKYAKKLSFRPKIFVVAVGAASNFNYFEKKIYKWSLKRVDKIWVRDAFSKSILVDFFSVESSTIPDIAFYGQCKKSIFQKENKVCLFGVYSFKEYKIKFNVDNHTNIDYYLIWEKKLFEYREEGYEVKLFYTTITDQIETFQFRDYILSKYSINLEIINTNSLNKLYESYSYSECVYSARMHALLLAKKMGIKAEAFIISQKLRSFNDEYISSSRTPMDYQNLISMQIKNYI